MQLTMKTLRSMPTIVVAGLLYFLKIIAFAILYSVLFWVQPDNFNFTNGYNVRPLSGYTSNFYEVEDPSSLTKKDFRTAINEFQESTFQLEKLYNIYVELEEKTHETDSAFEQLSQELSASRDTAISQYILKNIAPLQLKRSELEIEMNLLPIGAQERVKIADQMVRLSEESYQHQSYIISNFGGFVSQELLDNFDRLRSEKSTIGDKYNRAQKEFRKQRSDVYSAFVEARKSIISQIGFCDFLYFSTGVSTTTTFGDIVPNNSGVRMLVTLQILAGILLLGFILNGISATKPK